MPIIRATWFFKDDSGYGWSESLHCSAATTTLPAALDLAIALAKKRVKILGKGVQLPYLRVSDDLQKGDSQIYELAPNEAANTDSHAGDHDIANACILLRMQANDDFTRAPYYIRGQSDDVIQDGIFVPGPMFNPAFNAWSKLVKDAQWSLKTRKGVNIQFDGQVVSQSTTTGDITMVTNSPNSFSIDTPIVITQCRAFPALNGSYNIKQIVDTTHFIIGFTRLIPVGFITFKAKKLGFVLNPITQVIIRRAGHRNTGRPFDSPVGRRRKRQTA